jgi:hypothetical protein
MGALSRIEPRFRIAAHARERLDAMRVAITRELAAFPPPVPACDVDFNRLLEDRARIADELQRLARLLEQGADEPALRAFCRSSAFLGEDATTQIDHATRRSDAGSRDEAGNE